MKTSQVTAILGARQVGKTTLSKALISKIPDALYIDLEKPADRDMFADQ